MNGASEWKNEVKLKDVPTRQIGVGATRERKHEVMACILFRGNGKDCRIRMAKSDLMNVSGSQTDCLGHFNLRAGSIAMASVDDTSKKAIQRAPMKEDELMDTGIKIC